MRAIPPITIEQYCGKCKGILVALPQDWVLAHTPAGVVKVGIVQHYEGAPVQFLRWLQPAMREAIRKQVAELRKQRGGNAISPHTSSVPDPRLIRGFLKGEKFRKKPTTIIVPSAAKESDE